MDTILLIEDTQDERNKLKPAIEQAIKKYNLETTVQLEILTENDNIEAMFPKNQTKETNALEDRLSTYFDSRKNEIKLLVIDHDLSGYNNDKLSEPVISIASHASSIPLVRYARISRKSVDNLSDAIDAGSEFSIKVDINNPETAAENIINIYSGFQIIKSCIESMNPEDRKKGPAHIMSQITKLNTQEDNFWMYVSGANILKELIEFQNVENQNVINQKEKLIIDRLSYVIGYWFYNIVLSFPGVILNSIAASSYLNIKKDDLLKNKSLFEEAKFNGPFSLTKTYWWKEYLDELIDNEKVETGHELLHKNGITVSKEEYGYYCIMTKKPISYEQSKSLSWLPAGALLSRVDIDLYDQYAPFFGEY